MIKTNTIQSLSFFLLVLLIFTLPSFEAPKTIFLILFIVITLFYPSNQFHFKKLTLSDFMIIYWILIGFVCAYFSGIDHKEWSGARSATLIPLFLLTLKHSRFSEKEFTLLYTSIIISTLLSLTEGYWQLLNHHKTTLELHSVGHVNHSAIYLALTYSVALAYLLVPSTLWYLRILAATATIILFASIIISDSRASVFTIILVSFSFVFIRFRQSKKPIITAFVLAALLLSVLYVNKAPIVTKTLSQVSSNSVLSARIKIWNTAILTWKNNPVFGVGLKNYSDVNEKQIKSWLHLQKQPYLKDTFLPYSHAHSLFFNTLAEQGFIGLVSVFTILFYICFLLYKHRPAKTETAITCLTWLGAVGSMEVIMINGLFNTTLHHEHGLLAILLIGLWWSRLQSQPTLPRSTVEKSAPY